MRYSIILKVEIISKTYFITGNISPIVELSHLTKHDAKYSTTILPLSKKLEQPTKQ